MIYISCLAILLSIYLYKNLLLSYPESIDVEASRLPERPLIVEADLRFDTSTGVLCVKGEEIRRFNSCSRNYKIIEYLSNNANTWVGFSELEKHINLDVSRKNLHDMKLPSSILELSKDSVRLIS